MRVCRIWSSAFKEMDDPHNFDSGLSERGLPSAPSERSRAEAMRARSGGTMLFRTLSGLFVLVGAMGCGGGGSKPPSSSSATGPETETFMGTARITESGGCSGERHAFDTGEGVVVIALVQSTGSAAMAAQLCDPVADNHEVDCTIPPFARIGVGQTASATIKGGRSQILTLFPASCGMPVAEPTAPIAYTVSVVHPR
jgi:hypothetical protein